MSAIRNIAWRRFKKRCNRGKGMGSKNIWKPEKKWKLVPLRSEKVTRARQLGFPYPTLNMRQMIEAELELEER